MNEWTIYWITRLDKIHFINDFICLTFIIVVVIFGIATFFLWLDGENEKAFCCLKITLILFIIAFISCLIVIFIPTTKQMLLIKDVPAIINSKETSKLRVALNKLLDEYINKDKEKEKK